MAVQEEDDGTYTMGRILKRRNSSGLNSCKDYIEGYCTERVTVSAHDGYVAYLFTGNKDSITLSNGFLSQTLVMIRKNTLPLHEAKYTRYKAAKSHA